MFKDNMWDFPDGPVVRTLHFHFGEHESNLWLGLSSHKLLAKKKKKRERERERETK